MSDLIIDAPLLACPNPNQWSKEDFQAIFTDYISRLADLALLKNNCKSIKFWRDEDLSIVLNEQNCYPFRHSLIAAFENFFNPLEFQLEDINNLATALLDKSWRIEEFSNIKDIVVSNCSIIGDPATNRSILFSNHLCRVIALALPLLGDGKDFHNNIYIASCGSGVNYNKVEVNYVIDMVEKSDGTYLADFNQASVRIENYHNATKLFKDADLTTWWRNCTKQSVVDVCAIHASIGQNDPWQIIKATLGTFAVGVNFISSAESLGFMRDSSKIDRLLRACGDLALGRNLASSHFLRVGKGGNDAQKIRNGWRAWRHDIDYEFHLHYWRDGSKIELANVVVHNDFDITR